MLTRLFRHRRAAPPPTEILAGLTEAESRSRVPLMVLALAHRLGGGTDALKCLQLAAVAGVTHDAAERLGGAIPALVRERAEGISREARLVTTLERLDARIRLNGTPAYRWSDADRHRLFDPDFLARRCAGDPLLAELNDLIWQQGVEQLRRSGENPAEVALEGMGLTRRTLSVGTRRSDCR
jgi:hypothetical protein